MLGKQLQKLLLGSLVHSLLWGDALLGEGMMGPSYLPKAAILLLYVFPCPLGRDLVC